jgi:hypothetical protein
MYIIKIKGPCSCYFYVGDNGVSVGHIVLIAPRSPEGVGARFEENPTCSDVLERFHHQAEGGPGRGDASTSKENRQNYPKWQHKDCEERDLDKKWGLGPYLTEVDVKNIEGCPGGLGCCECCHKNWCGSCFKFPRHPTANQFYTPPMFTAYHREGYRVCMECNDFLEK